VLPFATSDNMNDMIAAGHAIRVESSSELGELMLGTVSTSMHPEVSSFYFAPNARENMHQMLDAILAKRAS
jgi:hypothetical protein